MKTIKKNTLFLVAGLFIFLIFILAYRQYNSDKNAEYPKLWLGLIKSKNFRDVGESLNDCAQENLLKSNKIFRANKYFSGWSCQSIGAPHKIYSLNFDAKNPAHYFCYEDDGDKNIGRYFNDIRITEDLANLNSWNNPKYKEDLCQFIRNILHDIENNEKVLIHCNAGKDRTGVMSALLGAVFLETTHISQKNLPKILECDYRKTKSLESFKFGFVSKMIEELFYDYGGPSLFLNKTCDISLTRISKARLKMLQYK